MQKIFISETKDQPITTVTRQRQVQRIKSELMNSTNEDLLRSQKVQLYPQVRIFPSDSNKKRMSELLLQHHSQQKIPYGFPNQCTEGTKKITISESGKRRSIRIPLDNKSECQFTESFADFSVFLDPSHIVNSSNNTDASNQNTIQNINKQEVSYFEDLDDDLSMDSVTNSSVDYEDESHLHTTDFNTPELKEQFCQFESHQEQENNLHFHKEDKKDNSHNLCRQLSRRKTNYTDNQNKAQTIKKASFYYQSQKQIQVMLLESDDDQDFDISFFESFTKRRKIETSLDLYSQTIHNQQIIL